MTTFGPSETITIADLRVGDFIETIPTQSGVRGTRLGSGVASLETGYRWSRSNGRGRSRSDVASIEIATLRGQRVDVPATFSVVVRRVVAEVTA